MDIASIFSIKTEGEFVKKTLEVFDFQYNNNKLYQQFCDYLHRNPSNVTTLHEIPFLPIEFFKTHSVFCGNQLPEMYFSSSGTTGMATSKHFVKDISVYEESFRKGFEFFYGNIKDYIILALLPSYLERSGSSLVYMIDDLIKENPESGFYLHNINELVHKLETLEQSGKKIILIGVSFALLDLVEKYSFRLKNTIVMETGGMKGRRKELIREELHQILKTRFSVQSIHSEYGMTELFSQAYSFSDGIFRSVPWMKILTRDPEDALSTYPNGKTGGLNIIDLANVHTCSFIATQDLGKTYPDGSFEILGRFDNSDIRGCNLLVL